MDGSAAGAAEPLASPAVIQSQSPRQVTDQAVPWLWQLIRYPNAFLMTVYTWYLSNSVSAMLPFSADHSAVLCKYSAVPLWVGGDSLRSSLYTS